MAGIFDSVKKVSYLIFMNCKVVREPIFRSSCRDGTTGGSGIIDPSCQLVKCVNKMKISDGPFSAANSKIGLLKAPADLDPGDSLAKFLLVLDSHLVILTCPDGIFGKISPTITKNHSSITLLSGNTDQWF